MADTPGIVFLRKNGVSYTEYFYRYVEHGGTAVSSETLGVPEHEVVKTLVMEDEQKEPLVVLMHGDRKVSTKELARQAGKKRIAPCKPEDAQRHSGYQLGGCSPFGLRRPLPVYMERSILELPRILINAGQRGRLVAIDPKEIVRVLAPVLVEVALQA